MSRGGSGAIFLDKDGTLIEDIPYNVDPASIRLMPRADLGLRRLYQAGYSFIIISNQSGVARGYFEEQALEGVRLRLQELLGQAGISLAGFYYCPHHPEGKIAHYAVKCKCRKPLPGLVFTAAQDLGIDLRCSWFIGNTLTDVEAGQRAGCRTILLDRGQQTKQNTLSSPTPDYHAADLAESAELIFSAATELTALSVSKKSP